MFRWFGGREEPLLKKFKECLSQQSSHWPSSLYTVYRCLFNPPLLQLVIIDSGIHIALNWSGQTRQLHLQDWFIVKTLTVAGSPMRHIALLCYISLGREIYHHPNPNINDRRDHIVGQLTTSALAKHVGALGNLRLLPTKTFFVLFTFADKVQNTTKRIFKAYTISFAFWNISEICIFVHLLSPGNVSN